MDIRSEALKALEQTGKRKYYQPIGCGHCGAIDTERFDAIADYAEEYGSLPVNRFSVASGDATNFEIKDLTDNTLSALLEARRYSQ